MSLRSRLLLAAAAMVALALVAVDLVSYAQLKSNLYRQVGVVLANDLQFVTLNQPDVRVVGGYIEYRGPDNSIIGRSPGTRYEPDLPAVISGYSLPRGSNQLEVSFTVASTEPNGPSFRVLAEELSDGEQVILALPLDEVGKTLHHQVRVDLAVNVVALLGVLVLGWWLVQLSLRPLQQMEQTAGAIAEGDLDRRVPGDSEPTEVGRLARTLNVMLTRIQDAFAARDATECQLRQSEERLRRFVADASHELRTPVAAVGAYAELFERGAASRPEDLARVMAGIRSETARMGELVEDLLLLARLDEGRPLERQPVELVGLAAEAVGPARTVGPDWPVRLEANHTVEVIGDAARLRQVVDNLLANVRAHTPPGTATVVRVGAREGSGVIEVADNGPGLGGDSEGRVFERFYRADPSRSRQNGGAGLGLAIVAAIVAAHGGSVAAATTSGGGATFTVWLPTAPIVATDATVPADATVATGASRADEAPDVGGAEADIWGPPVHARGGNSGADGAPPGDGMAMNGGAPSRGGTPVEGGAGAGAPAIASDQ